MTHRYNCEEENENSEKTIPHETVLPCQQEQDEEEKELVSWMNAHLTKDGGPQIDDLRQSLKDGVAIIRLL